MQNQLKQLSQGATVAAIYVVLTFFSSALGLSSGAIQLRLSEMLTVLPWFTFSAVPGLSIGCFLANLLFGGTLLDIVFGSIATLVGGLGTYYLRKHQWLSFLPPILSNTLVVPLILCVSYGAKDSLGYFVLTVGIGEVLSCGVLGLLLRSALQKQKQHF